MAFGRCRKCRGGTPAGERARSGRAAQAAFSVARPVRRLRTGRGLRVCRRSASFLLFAGSEPQRVAPQQLEVARSGLKARRSPPSKRGEANKIRCLTSLAAGVRRETGIVLHPPPRKRGRGTTLRSRVVEGASDSTLRFRCRRSVESRAPPTAFGGPPSPLSRGGKEAGTPRARLTLSLHREA